MMQCNPAPYKKDQQVAKKDPLHGRTKEEGPDKKEWSGGTYQGVLPLVRPPIVRSRYASCWKAFLQNNHTTFRLNSLLLTFFLYKEPFLGVCDVQTKRTEQLQISRDLYLMASTHNLISKLRGRTINVKNFSRICLELQHWNVRKSVAHYIYV